MNLKTAVCLIILTAILGCSEKQGQWEYVEKIMLNGCEAIGVVSAPDGVRVSCKSDNLILTVNHEGYIKITSKKFVDPMYLSSDGNALLVTEFSKRAVSSLLGEEIFHLPIVSELINPIAALKFANALFIVDYNAHKVIYYKGNADLTFGEYGSGDRQFNHPKDVAVFNDHIYISDSGNKRIQMFDADGKFVKTYASNLDLKSCDGLLVTNDFIGITDALGNKVILLDHDGNVLQKFEEQFEFPSDLVIHKGKLLVSNTQGGYLSVLEKR